MTADQPMLLREDRGDGVLLLTLNRPEVRNALATPLLQAIAEALTDATKQKNIRCVVITGNNKVFAAGADIDELARSDGSEPAEEGRWPLWKTIETFPKPLVAAVEGWCLGAGSELMLRCDIVVAARGAKFGQPETNLGIVPGAGGTAILPRRIGMAVAMDMVLTGEPISGERAHGLGLVARLADDGAALETALALAGQLAGRAPGALGVAKASLKEAWERPLGEHLLAERKRFLGVLAGTEKQEGVTAFREKRAADWLKGSTSA